MRAQQLEREADGSAEVAGSASVRSVGGVEAVVDALCDANADFLQRRARGTTRPTFPAASAVASAVADLKAALFPWHFGIAKASAETPQLRVRQALARASAGLFEQVRLALGSECAHGHSPCARCAELAADVTDRFIASLPALRTLLETDAWAAFEGDPAASSPDEAVFCYPGVLAILHHRIAHELHRLGVPLVPRMISELAHSATGIDIHPGAQIGASFFIDHGTGVVIGETCIIGDRVRLYQGVTLGARTFPLDERGRPIKGVPRHPIVEDDVVIYAGATILGRVTIGRASTVGGNVSVTGNLPPRTHVSQAAFRRLFDGGAGI
jgi:serine O-acetyltransferase